MIKRKIARERRGNRLYVRAGGAMGVARYTALRIQSIYSRVHCVATGRPYTALRIQSIYSRVHCVATGRPATLRYAYSLFIVECTVATGRPTTLRYAYSLYSRVHCVATGRPATLRYAYSLFIVECTVWRRVAPLHCATYLPFAGEFGNLVAGSGCSGHFLASVHRVQTKCIYFLRHITHGRMLAVVDSAGLQTGYVENRKKLYFGGITEDT
ncbi:hypothetical protein EVAR_72866_1 [Eumeta japonica]|uniref:Uncharacterized protein n=1 Tax=Eumeta variegata TaxID=151549 RepID=A0A4C1SS96_EUMVA|nr:hypothetical protein EVAR_72866_1 [Eumeta japonica]